MATPYNPLSVPTQEDKNIARKAKNDLEKILKIKTNRKPLQINLKSDNRDVATRVPARFINVMIDILSQIEKGNIVTIVPIHADLTTQQAAEILNVSRPYVIKLIKEKKLPAKKVGTRRRIKAKDLFTFKKLLDEQTKDAMRNMIKEAKKLGIDS